jgi:hypothetical protein
MTILRFPVPVFVECIIRNRDHQYVNLIKYTYQT